MRVAWVSSSGPERSYDEGLADDRDAPACEAPPVEHGPVEHGDAERGADRHALREQRLDTISKLRGARRLMADAVARLGRAVPPR